MRSASRFQTRPKNQNRMECCSYTLHLAEGTNWFPPSYDPESGLFYVNAVKGYSLAYLTDNRRTAPKRIGGSGRMIGRRIGCEGD